MIWDTSPVLSADALAELRSLWMNQDYWCRGKNYCYWRKKDGFFIVISPKDGDWSWMVNNEVGGGAPIRGACACLQGAMKASFEKFVEMRNSC